MRYLVREGERSHQIEIEELGEHVYAVRVDGGEPLRVDAHGGPRGTYSLLIGGRQYEGGVDFGAGERVSVHLGPRGFDFSVSDARRQLFSAALPSAASGRQELRAPMPGRVIKLPVREGASVAVGEALAVIEAMKMENELRAPLAGVVSRVCVAEGDSVEADALLVVVEPPATDPPA
jgi:acetyl/propionyl-CoA carboxylase alpha subunit